MLLHCSNINTELIGRKKDNTFVPTNPKKKKKQKTDHFNNKPTQINSDTKQLSNTHQAAHKTQHENGSGQTNSQAIAPYFMQTFSRWWNNHLWHTSNKWQWRAPHTHFFYSLSECTALKVLQTCPPLNTKTKQTHIRATFTCNLTLCWEIQKQTPWYQTSSAPVCEIIPLLPPYVASAQKHNF